jgi:hypothetical protein
VALHKSEGVVKGVEFRAGAKHRLVSPEKVEDQGSGILRGITVRWTVVPPTIDSA